MRAKIENNHIPVFTLFDYMNGVATEDAFREYEAHIAKCEACQESVDYVQENRSYPFIIHTTEGSEFIPPTYHFTGDLSGSHISFVWRCFENHKNKVEIVAGEANVKVYTKRIGSLIHEILVSLNNELEYEDKMKMVCGPIITIDEEYEENDRSKGSIFTALAKDKNFLLFFSNRRQKDHFRIGGDKKDVYVEAQHAVCENHRESFFYAHDPIISKRYAMKLTNILNSSDVRLSKTPEKDFIFLKESELLRLKDIVNNKKLGYDNLTKEELEQIIKDYSTEIFN